MLVKARCEYCESEDLSLIDMVYGKGTLGERTEKGFKCNICDEELDLDEVIFDEVEVNEFADYLIENASYAFEHQDRELLERVLRDYNKIK